MQANNRLWQVIGPRWLPENRAWWPWCEYMYVDECVYVCVCSNMYALADPVYACVWMCVCMYVCSSTLVVWESCVVTLMWVYVCRWILEYVCALTCMYMLIFMWVYVCVCRCMCMYVCTHVLQALWYVKIYVSVMCVTWGRSEACDVCDPIHIFTHICMHVYFRCMLGASKTEWTSLMTRQRRVAIGMCVCMCVCVCVCIYMWMDVSYDATKTDGCRYVCMYVCICVFVNVYTCEWMFLMTGGYRYVYMYMCMYVCVYTLQIYMNEYTYTCMQTHMNGCYILSWCMHIHTTHTHVRLNSCYHRNICVSLGIDTETTRDLGVESHMCEM